jgi:hypothetical protein
MFSEGKNDSPKVDPMVVDLPVTAVNFFSISGRNF